MQEILIQISPDIDREITPEIGKEIFKPTLTKKQEVELVEKCLQLKAEKVRGINGFTKNIFQQNSLHSVFDVE
jgi:hypothetical protein